MVVVVKIVVGFFLFCKTSNNLVAPFVLIKDGSTFIILGVLSVEVVVVVVVVVGVVDMVESKKSLL